MTRGWLQIHLSTAIVMMFVAGGLLWLNLRPQQRVVIDTEIGNDSYEPVLERRPNPGWPLPFTERHTKAGFGVSYQLVNGVVQTIVNTGFPTEKDTVVTVYGGSLTLDIGIFFVALLSAGLICEWRIRRRETSKP
jgi:hypothetical protein